MSSRKESAPLWCIGLFLTTSLLSAREGSGWTDHNGNGGRDPYENPRLNVHDRVADLIGRMSLDEKVLVVSGRPVPDRLFRNPHLEIEADASRRAEGCTQFPQDIALGATWDPDLVREAEIIHEREGIARMHDKGLPPGAEEWGGGGGGDGNLARDPRWGRTDHLSKGEDPYLTSRMGSLGMVGAYNEENRRMDGSMTIPDQRLIREYYQAPLIRAFNTGSPPDVLMAAYHAINGVPNSASRFLLTDLLRRECGYDGYVVGDEMAVRKICLGHRYTATLEEAGVAALKAGLDMDVSSYPLLMTFDDALAPALRKGLISEDEINRAVGNILRVEFRRGMFDPPGTVATARVEFSSIPVALSTDIPYSIIHCDRHTEAAYRAAKECLVLLKNQNHFLPLDRTKMKRILVAGAADDRRLMLGGFGAYPYGRKAISTDVTPLMGIRNKLSGTGIEVLHETDLEEVVKAAGRSDAAVYFTSVKEGETFDRLNLHLTDDQEKQIQGIASTGTPTAVVIIGGNCILMENWLDQVPAVLAAWYPGQEGGRAIADALFGDCNPGGKLPVTFYGSEGQLAPFDDYDIRNPGMTYLYFKGEPRFSFGHGLSYTEFAYDRLDVTPARSGGEELHVRFDLKNVGGREGDEVAQVYVHDVKRSTGDQPIRQLVGFQRITLKPGEMKRVDIPVQVPDLAFFDADLNHVVEPGAFDLMVGSSSSDIRLRGSFEVSERILLKQGADLVFSGVDIPSRVRAGEPFTAAVSVENRGRATADPELLVYSDGKAIAKKRMTAGIGERIKTEIASRLYVSGSHRIRLVTENWKSEEKEITVVEPRPAAFETSGFKADARALAGGQVGITANVTNTGSFEGRARVDFYLDGVLTETKEVPLGPGISERVDFSRDLAYGDHQVRIGNLPAQTVVIGRKGVPALIPDVSGHGNDGAVKGSPSWAEGKFGKGLLFSGLNDYIAVSKNVFTFPMTVTLWARNLNPAQASIYLYAAANENGNGYGPDPETHIAADEGRHMFFCGGVPGPREGGTDLYGSAVTDRGWDFLSVVLDSTTRFYVNGEETSRKKFAPPPSFSKYFFTTIGRPARETRLFEGVLDEIRVYDRALSREEIRDIHENNSPIQEGLRFRMNFDQ